ncbi:MAG: hypothetical protein HYW33_00525 [Candidatus Blackburnbacteria bacterium]|nr:hypothetical protein [Candidatus Blackburnbacteria bacterium]
MKYLTAIGQFFTRSKKRIAVLLIVILLAAGYVFTSNNQAPATQTTSPLPTPTKALTIQEQNALQQNKQRLISQLPFSSEQFTVQYFPDQDYFLISIQRQPYENNKALAESWMRQNGVDPGYVTIQWSAVRGAGPRQ